MPNAFAYLALIAFPFTAAFFFRLWTVPTAVGATLIFGYLFLPSEPVFDFPLVPALDKNSIPALTAMLFGTLAVRASLADQMHAQRRGVKAMSNDEMLAGWLPRSTLPLIFLVLFFVVALGTLATNGETIRITAAAILPGLRPYDGFSMLLGLAFILPPFLLGRRFIFNAEHHQKLLVVFATGGLIYSLLALVEIRMSPQLNTWVYGYFPHSFAQHVRGGSYRPLVFLQHGLWLAIFQAMAMTAALALSRCVEPKHRAKWLAAALWIFAVMFLSNSLGGFALAGMMLVALLMFPARILGFFCVSLVFLVLLYPVARIVGLVPVDAIVDLASRINPARAQSLNFRFINEEWLLAKALDKPLFGWGGWGRSLIYDTVAGTRLSTVDSQWILSLGIRGVLGLTAEYGLYVVALIGIGFGMTRQEIPMATRGLMAMLTINIIDTLINATSTSQTWLIAGALTGYFEAQRARKPAEAPAVQEETEAEAAPAGHKRARGGGLMTARRAAPNGEGRAPAAPRTKEPVAHSRGAKPPRAADEDLGELARYTRQRTKHVRPV